MRRSALLALLLVAACESKPPAPKPAPAAQPVPAKQPMAGKLPELRYYALPG